MRRILSSLGVLAALLLAPAASRAAEPLERVVSLSPSTTEILFALGAGEQVVGIDDASAVIAAAAQRPRVGPARTPSLDALYPLKPTRVIALRGGVPVPVLEQLRKSGIAVELLEPDDTAAGLPRRIKSLGVIVGRGAEARSLAHKAELSLERLASMRDKNPTPVPAIFLTSAVEGRLVAAGQGTMLQALLELAGGRNLAAALGPGDALDAAGLAALAPQVIVMRKSAVEKAGGKAAVLALPSIAATTAGATASLVVMDDEDTVGFGPGAVEAAFELFKALRR